MTTTMLWQIIAASKWGSYYLIVPKGLFAFKEKYKTKAGVVITKSYLDKKDDIIYIPFWMI